MQNLVNHRQIRKLNIIVLLLLTSISFMHLRAQNEKTFQAGHSYSDSVVAYLSPLEYAFMFHEDNKWLLKTTLLIDTDNNGAKTLKFSYEQKLNEGFSLHAALFNYTVFNLGLDPGGYYNFGLEHSLELRWYYRTRAMKQSKKAFGSLSGAYFALGAGYRKLHTSNLSATDYNNLDFVPVFAKWGFQRRFLKRGYVDVGLTAGNNFSLGDQIWSSMFFGTYVDVGLAFARDRQKLDRDKLCPVLRCQAADRFIVKTNLINIVQLTYVRKSLIGSINPNIAAEYKLGESPFSIHAAALARIEYTNAASIDFRTLTFTPEITLTGRYYYSLKRRMLLGKSGNGLSANYVSVGGIYRGYYSNYYSVGHSSSQSNYFTGALVKTGIQRLLTEHLYFDISMGLGYGMQHNYYGYTDRRSSYSKTIFDLGIGIGYRF